MSRWSEREIARKLAERDELEPPAGLLEKIKSEIPPMIPVETGAPEIDRRPPSMPPRQRWLIAASVVLAIGAGGLLTFHRMEVPPVEERARTAEGLRQPDPRGVPPPPPPTVPPPAAHPLAQPLVQPGEAPAPKPLSRQEEEKIKSLGYVSSEADGRAEGGAPAGVMGGAAGSEPAPPPPAAVPTPSAEVQAPAEKKAADAEAPLLDERRRSANLAAPGAPAPLQEAAKPQAAARAKAADSGMVWSPPPFLAPIKADTGTASYDVARRAIAAGRLPDPGEIRVGEILNAFDTGDAPPLEGAPTPFLHGPQYRLVRINTSGVSPVRVTFNSTLVARCREVGSGVSMLYEVELRPGVSHSDEMVGMLGLWPEATGLTLPQLASSWDKASPGFRLAALAAEFAEILKSPPVDPSALHRLSKEIGKLPRGPKVSELRKLVERVERIREKR